MKSYFEGRSFKNVKQEEHPLFGSQSWTIGRRDSNDFVVDNIAVSSVHARIDKVEQGYLVHLLIAFQLCTVEFVLECSLMFCTPVGFSELVDIFEHSLSSCAKSK